MKTLTKKILYIICVLLILSCNNKKSILPGDSIEESLKALLTYKDHPFLIYDNEYYHYLYNEELLKSLKIEKEINISQKNLCLVFFSYTIDSKNIKNSQWFRKVKGKWTLTNNPKIEDDDYEKELQKKIKEWENYKDKIWE